MQYLDTVDRAIHEPALPACVFAVASVSESEAALECLLDVSMMSAVCNLLAAEDVGAET